MRSTTSNARFARRALLAFALDVTACSSPQRVPTPVPPLTEVSYVVDGDRRQNPDELGRPLPTIVRIYQLKSVSRLELATFETLWRTPAVALGDQLLSVEEMTVYPATRVARTVARVPEARFVAAVAIVRQPAGAVWRAVVPLSTPQQEAACASLREADARLGFRLEGWRIEESAAALLPPDEEGIAASPQPARCPTVVR